MKASIRDPLWSKSPRSIRSSERWGPWDRQVKARVRQLKSTSLVVTDADVNNVLKSLDPKRDVYLINIARIALGRAPDPSWQGECEQALARRRIAAHIKVHQALSGDPTYPLTAFTTRTARCATKTASKILVHGPGERVKDNER